MAKRKKRQYATYTNDEFGKRIEDTADEYEISVAKLLREGARRQIMALEGLEGAGDD